MGKGRLEAFSDGVIAIIITIMVLELKAPHSTEFHALVSLLPAFSSYVLSFIFVGIYWNNHHHMLNAVTEINGSILWANLHLLFWLSIIPFTTTWMGENAFASLPVAIYGIILFMAALAYYLLTRLLIAHHGQDPTLALAVGKDSKGILSLVFYAIAIAFAFYIPWLSLAFYVLVAMMWFIPDKRIEKQLIAEE
jgi:uncharacterized membrane protein